MAFSLADFFAYIKALLTKRTLGLSDFDYPQTVQHFILDSFPHSFYHFLFILVISLCTFGVSLFFLTAKIEMRGNFSELSRFLCMDKDRIARQAKFAALPKQILFWSFFAPAIFVALLFLEAKFEIPGLGNTIKTAFYHEDFSLLYGSLCVAFIFIFAMNIFFLTIKNILPRK